LNIGAHAWTGITKSVIFVWWQESNFFIVTFAHLLQAVNPANLSLASGVYVFRSF
jgi:hypothetical protein